MENVGFPRLVRWLFAMMKRFDSWTECCVGELRLFQGAQKSLD